jgi:hypothetical protein
MIAWAALVLMAAGGIGMAIMENNATPADEAAAG